MRSPSFFFVVPTPHDIYFVRLFTFIYFISHLFKYFVSTHEIIVVELGILSYRRSVPSPHPRTPFSTSPYHPPQLGLNHILEGAPHPSISLSAVTIDSGAGRPAVRHASPRRIEHAPSWLNPDYFVHSNFCSPATSPPFKPSSNTLAQREYKGE